MSNIDRNLTELLDLNAVRRAAYGVADPAIGTETETHLVDENGFPVSNRIVAAVSRHLERQGIHPTEEVVTGDIETITAPFTADRVDALLTQVRDNHYALLHAARSHNIHMLPFELSPFLAQEELEERVNMRERVRTQKLRHDKDMPGVWNCCTQLAAEQVSISWGCPDDAFDMYATLGAMMPFLATAFSTTPATRPDGQDGFYKTTRNEGFGLRMECHGVDGALLPTFWDAKNGRDFIDRSVTFLAHSPNIAFFDNAGGFHLNDPDKNLADVGSFLDLPREVQTQGNWGQRLSTEWRGVNLSGLPPLRRFDVPRLRVEMRFMPRQQLKNRLGMTAMCAGLAFNADWRAQMQDALAHAGLDTRNPQSWRGLWQENMASALGDNTFDKPYDVRFGRGTVGDFAPVMVQLLQDLAKCPDTSPLARKDLQPLCFHLQNREGAHTQAWPAALPRPRP